MYNPRAARSGRALWLLEPNEPAPPETLGSMLLGSGYRIESAAPLGAAELSTLLHDRQPRLLVAHVAWCDRIGVQAVRDVHRHAPGCDWVLRWPEPSPRWLELLVASGARAAIEPAADAITISRAFDGVCSGDLCLPVQVIKWLAASTLDSHGGGPSTGPSSLPWSPDSDLTEREHEVAALMRQGLTNQQIAERLGVSVNTVKKHLGSAYGKLGIRSRRQAKE